MKAKGKREEGFVVQEAEAGGACQVLPRSDLAPPGGRGGPPPVASARAKRAGAPICAPRKVLGHVQLCSGPVRVPAAVHATDRHARAAEEGGCRAVQWCNRHAGVHSPLPGAVPLAGCAHGARL